MSQILTFESENHPHTTVYNGDVNVLLKHAIETSLGKHPRPLRTVEDIDIPPMPKQGEVDFIYGGTSQWNLLQGFVTYTKAQVHLVRDSQE